VFKGDNVAAMTLLARRLLTAWANRWIAFWTDGEGEFVTSAMEDSGTLQALTCLDQAGRVDRDRVLVLRTGSNFTMQHPGITAAESLAGETRGLSAFLPSLEAAGGSAIGWSRSWCGAGGATPIDCPSRVSPGSRGSG
jgi:purine nucleoside permease